MTIGKDRAIDPPVVFGPNEGLLYGVELEIEGLYRFDTFSDLVVSGMRWHEDGSLRNNGAEYVTEPMNLHTLTAVLTEFFDKNNLDESNYSERCSVHVHCNVLDMTWEQLATLTMVYMVFERVLFQYIGDERDKNIFCVPLYDTVMSRSLLTPENVREYTSALGTWQKYTALNFLPIFEQGSIEFRHMGGTYRVDRILTWCSIIGKMFEYAKKTSYSDAKNFFSMLNTSSAYYEAVSSVFGEHAPVFLTAPGFQSCVEEGVLLVKYALSKKPTLSKKGRATIEWATIADLNQAVESTPLVESVEPELQTHVGGGGEWFIDGLIVDVPNPPTAVSHLYKTNSAGDIVEIRIRWQPGIQGLAPGHDLFTIVGFRCTNVGTWARERVLPGIAETIYTRTT